MSYSKNNFYQDRNIILHLFKTSHSNIIYVYLLLYIKVFNIQ